MDESFANICHAHHLHEMGLRVKFHILIKVALYLGLNITVKITLNRFSSPTVINSKWYGSLRHSTLSLKLVRKQRKFVEKVVA